MSRFQQILRVTACALALWIMPAALALGIMPAAQAKTEADVQKIRVVANPFAELAKHKGWLNTSRALTEEDLRGRMILLDFWTFCCVNCLQVFPEIAKLEKEFGDDLTVIGVHSAKFKNEGDSENIRQAIVRYDLHHPVVNDFDFSTWNSFGVKAWPTFVLINPNGKVEATYGGEGHFEALERDIQRVSRQFHAQIRREPLPLAAEADKESFGLLQFPSKIAYMPHYMGNPALVVADTGSGRIWITVRDGKVLDVIGTGKEGKDDGSFQEAQFNHPQGVVVAGDSLYVADTGNHTLRRADLKDRKVTTVVGNGKQGYDYGVKNVPALMASLASPWDVAMWPDDKHVVIAMAGLHQLWSYDVEKKTVSVLAGTGDEGLEDGAALEAHLAQPSGLSALGDKLYFVDAETSSLRVLSKGQVKTLIGSGLFDFGYKAGTKAVARMQHPLGLVATDAGIFVADAYNHAIRRYDLSKAQLQDFAGTGERGKVNAARAKASFNEPSGIAYGERTLFVADTNNRQVRVIGLDKAEVAELAVHEDAAPVAVSLMSELPNVINDKEVVLALQTPVQITLGLQKGWHINKDAPSYLALFDMIIRRPVVSFDHDMLDQNRMQIPPREGHMYRMQGTLYYCEDKEGAQCMVASVDMPVRFEDKAPKTFQINLN